MDTTTPHADEPDITHQTEGTNSALPTDPALRHRAISDTFGERVRGVRDWEVPSPVPEWTARDVVRHLIEWFPAFLRDGTTRTWQPGPSVDDDPVAAWQAQVDGVQALLDDPEIAASPFVHPNIPAGNDLATTIDSFYTADVYMHTWDLARATGQDDRLDPGLATELLQRLQQMEEILRSSGQYGPAVPVPQDAPVQDKLVGFIGRDPVWSPPA